MAFSPLEWSLLGLALLGVVGLLWLLRHWSKQQGEMMQGVAPEKVEDTATRLYGNELSHNTRYVRFLLALKGIEYEYQEVATLASGRCENMMPKFLRLCPTGQLPVLVQDGQLIAGTKAIIDAISKTGKSKEKNTPDTLAWVQRASMQDDMRYAELEQNAGDCVAVLTRPFYALGLQDTSLWSLFVGFLLNRFWTVPRYALRLKIWGPKWAIKRERWRDEFHTARDALLVHLKAAQKHLKETDKKFFFGDTPTLVDASWASLLHRLHEVKFFDYYVYDAALPHLRRYYERWTQEPLWEAAIGATTSARLTKLVEGYEYLVETDPILQRVMFVDRLGERPFT